MAWLANSVANLAAGYTPGLAAGLALANCIEVSIALGALGGWLRAPADLFQRGVLWRFFGAAVLLAPAAAALIGSGMLVVSLGVDFGATATKWYGPSALGMAVAVPLTLALRSCGPPCGANAGTTACCHCCCW